MPVGGGDEHLPSLPEPLGEFPFEILSRRRRREYALIDHLTDDVFECRELPLQVAVADWLAMVSSPSSVTFR